MSDKTKKTEENIENEINESENIEKKIAELEIALANEKERALMVLADFENYKKRIQKEREEINLIASASSFAMILEIMDDLGRGLAQMSEPPVGLTIISDKIKNLLSEHGIEEIEVKVDDEFNPKLMQAVGTITVKEDEKNNKVIHVDQKGYKMKDKDMVIRVARVIVGKK